MQDIRYLNDSQFNECLDCGHKSTKWAEIDGKELNDGTSEVFCPNCLSEHYYLI